METETLNDKMGIEESETLVNPLAHMPSNRKPELVVHTLAHTLAKTKSETLGKTHNPGHCGRRDTEEAEVETEKFADTLGAVPTEALFEKLGGRLAVV